jgi:DNA polymerase-4
MANQHKNKVIFLVDMQSFYASVEKAAHPEYKDRPLIVAGDPARRSGIVLAACPLAKKQGITTAERLGSALKRCPEAVVVQPRMQQYINISIHITNILERFSDLVEPYSIDEQFVDVTGSQTLFGPPEQIAYSIQEAIAQEIGVYARVGIGPNKLLAKVACDNFAKKNKNGIFNLNHSNMQESMWSLPVSNMFGIGGRMTYHLMKLGIHTVGDLAKFPLEKLQQRWGINGHVLWLSANGKDTSPVSPHTHETQKAIGHHMTLPRDFASWEDIQVVLLELSEEVCRRARLKGFMGQTVSVSCRGADFDHPTGFHRQSKLADPTQHASDVFEAIRQLFQAFWDGQPIRGAGVALSQLTSDDLYQIDLFRDQEKERQLDSAMDTIKTKYGTGAIVRAASLTHAGQAYERSAKIGGHYK